MELCNSFDENQKVIFGHDYGAAVWIQAVKVNLSDKITDDDVTEIGKELSVEKRFFDRFLKSYFMESFDVGSTVNKNRYTYAFSGEGRYLKGFEEDILEHNFFTVEQMKKIINKIESGSMEVLQCADAKQLKIFVDSLKTVVAECRETLFVSVMS